MKKMLAVVLALVIAIGIPSIASAGNGNELYITSDKTQESAQGIVLSDDQLISLFNVASNYGDLLNGQLTVEHDIDFNTVGTYNIKFIASYQEVLCFDDKEDEDGPGTGKNQNGSLDEVGTYCQNNADDGEVGDNDRYKYIDKQKVQTAKLTIVEPQVNLQITSLNNQADYEHIIYTDQELIDLFEVEVLGADEGQQIVVTHNIDFEKPDFYDVTFTVGEVSKTVKYQVIDLKPTLTSNDEYTINVGDEVYYFTAYNINAAEFEDYDLNQFVKVHDEEVDYQTPGDYPITLSVSDQEGNVVIKNIVLHIVDSQTLNAKPVVERPVGVSYTDDQLKTLFELTANYQLDFNNVEVEHQIDFNTIGEYSVTFTDLTNGKSVTTIYRVVEPVERNLQIEKICTPVGNQLTKQDYIDEYNKQVSEIKDSSILETLEIDDSLVNYQQVGVYQVNVKAINNAGETLNRVLALCITDDIDEEESEVDNEESEVDNEESEVDNEESEVDNEESEVDNEESEVDNEESEVDNEVAVDVCTVVSKNGKPLNLLSKKISTVSIAPTDSISSNMLRNLFEQPEDAVVIHDIIPSVVGNYKVRFERGDCSFTGTVQVKEQQVITGPEKLEEYLEQHKLNTLDPTSVSAGEYNVTVIDPESGDESVEQVTYKLANTGRSVSSTTLSLVVLSLIAIVVLVLRIKNSN